LTLKAVIEFDMGRWTKKEEVEQIKEKGGEIQGFFGENVLRFHIAKGHT
jgi:hypothetical protein